jgi:hypothetical protein
MIVDANGVDVGLLDLGAGVITRKVGNDLLMLSVTPAGFVQRDTTFYHTSSDCSGQRFLPNNGGVFAYFGWYTGSALFYTQLSDPSSAPMAEELNSYEVVKPGDDPLAMGACTPYPLGLQSAGAVQTVIDPGLSSFVAPFRLK